MVQAVWTTASRTRSYDNTDTWILVRPGRHRRREITEATDANKRDARDTETQRAQQEVVDYRTHRKNQDRDGTWGRGRIAKDSIDTHNKRGEDRQLEKKTRFVSTQQRGRQRQLLPLTADRSRPTPAARAPCAGAGAAAPDVAFANLLDTATARRLRSGRGRRRVTAVVMGPRR